MWMQAAADKPVLSRGAVRSMSDILIFKIIDLTKKRIETFYRQHIRLWQQPSVLKKETSRARKAKAKEKKSGIDEDFSLLLRRLNGRECMHGFLPCESTSTNLRSYSGHVINIYDILATVVEVICVSERRNDRVGGAFEAARQATVDKYPSLYKDAAALGLLSQAFLCTGTELLLDRRAGTSTRFQLDIKAKNLFRCSIEPHGRCTSIDTRRHCPKLSSI